MKMAFVLITHKPSQNQHHFHLRWGRLLWERGVLTLGRIPAFRTCGQNARLTSEVR